MHSDLTTPQRQAPRAATFPWTDSAASVGTPSSAAALTPPSQRAAMRWDGHSSCSPLGAKTAPIPGRIHTPGTPVARGSAAVTTTPDRFIADRASQDASLAHFLLTAEENTTPVTTRYTVAGEGLGAGHDDEDDSAPIAQLFTLASATPFRGTAAPPLRASREREAWGGHNPFGAPVATSDTDDDNTGEEAVLAGRRGGGILVASPLVSPPHGFTRTASFDVSGAGGSGGRAVGVHARSVSSSVQALFATWHDDSSRASSVAGGVMPNAGSPLPASMDSGWSSPLVGSALSRGYAARGGGDPQRSPSASLPRAGVAPTSAVLGASRASTARSLSTPMSHHGGAELPTSMSGSCSNVMMETEPYTSKLARALFTRTNQTSVLGLHSAGGASGRGEHENDLQEEANVSRHAHRTTPMTTTVREASRFHNALGVVYEQNRAANFQSQSFRVIAQTPERILDAADMADDFYLNLVDWSVSNVLCVALQSAVYLWEATSCNITQLPISRAPDAPSSLVCGVQWAPDGQHLSLGFNDGSVEVWDVEAQQVVQTWQDHTQRVGALSWAGGETCVVASGSKDATICLRDLRDPNAFSTLRCHEQEVCGLRWSPNSYHLASGGNDNQVLVWDRRWIASEQRTTSSSGSAATASSASSSPFGVNAWASHAPRATPVLYLNQHTAAVKALAWNPVQPSLLASGGGTDDRTLRFWNTQTGDCLHSLDTGSQVCGVLWSRSGTELVSSHGFSMNQLSIWKYPSLRKVIDLTGHTSRVLHLCLAADGEVVVSAAGDETIRFWRCFPPQPSPASASAAVGSGFSARRGHGLGGSSSSSGSPTSKHVGGSPYFDHYGSHDEAAMSGRRGSDAAVTAATAAGATHSPWSRYTSPLAGSRLAGVSPTSGGRGQLLDAPRFASDEDMALR